MLILVNCPIGRLTDISLQSLEALRHGKLFAVEDTRNLRKLLSHLEISSKEKKIYSFHDHSENQSLDFFLDLALEQDLYVLSDAGSPSICDPAYEMVAQAWERGISVDSYSGISAPLMALELSGLPPLPHQFHGFFPRKAKRQEEVSIYLKALGGTHLFFDSPERLEKTLDFLTIEFPNDLFFVGRELTKKFQTLYRFLGKEWEEKRSEVRFQGECVLILNIQGGDFFELLGAQKEAKSLAEKIVEKGARPKDLAKLLSLLTGGQTKEIYGQLLAKSS